MTVAEILWVEAEYTGMLETLFSFSVLVFSMLLTKGDSRVLKLLLNLSAALGLLENVGWSGGSDGARRSKYLGEWEGEGAEGEGEGDEGISTEGRRESCARASVLLSFGFVVVTAYFSQFV